MILLQAKELFDNNPQENEALYLGSSVDVMRDHNLVIDFPSPDSLDSMSEQTLSADECKITPGCYCYKGRCTRLVRKTEVTPRLRHINLDATEMLLNNKGWPIKPFCIQTDMTRAL